MASKECDENGKAAGGSATSGDDAAACARTQEEKLPLLGASSPSVHRLSRAVCVTSGQGKRPALTGPEYPNPFALVATQATLSQNHGDASTHLQTSDQEGAGTTDRACACSGSAQLACVHSSLGLGSTPSRSDGIALPVSDVRTPTNDQRGAVVAWGEDGGEREREDCRRRLLALTSGVFSADPYFPGCASKCSTPAGARGSPERPVYHIHVECGETTLPVDGAPSAAMSVRRRSNSSSTLVADGVSPTQQRQVDDTASAPQSPPLSFARGARQLLSSGHVWLFLSKAFLLGFGTGTIGTWLLIYMASLGAPHALQGLMLTVNCVAEVPVFHFQEAFTSRFPTNTILHVSIGTMVVRLLAYSALPSLPGVPWVVLPVELLHGTTFALCWGASCVHCKTLAPRALQATMQGLMQSVFNGVGVGLGGLAGAILHQNLGGRLMFLSTAAIVGAGWALLATAEFLQLLLTDRRQRRRWYGSRASSA